MLLPRCTDDGRRCIDNQRPDVGVSQRQHSPIIGLKSFNNWVKSVLIAKFAHPALRGTQDDTSRGKGPNDGKFTFTGVPTKGKVLDMGCGKGGDLNKWQKAKVKEYIGVGACANLSFQHPLVLIPGASSYCCMIPFRRYCRSVHSTSTFTIQVVGCLASFEKRSSVYGIVLHAGLLFEPSDRRYSSHLSPSSSGTI